VAYKSEDKLSRIKEASMCYIYQNLNYDVIRSSIAMFIIDLARNAIKEKEANEALYNFLKKWLIALDDKSVNLTFIPIYFSIQLADYLGFGINDNLSEENKYFDLMHGEYIDNDIRHSHIMNEDQSAILHKVITHKDAISIDKEERNILLNRLLEYYKLHIEGFKDLKSLDVIRSVLS
jgi:DNA repair protein RecO (recombination protein O)